MKTTIGFINTRLYTDIKSVEIFEENGKTYAVDVKKEVGDVEPEFIEGGFVARCVNQNEVWRSGVVVRDGTPFEVEERNGVWGFVKDSVKVIEFGKGHPIYEKDEKAWLEEMAEKGYFAELIEDDWRKVYRYFKPTKNGTPRKKFVKLGTVEKTCKWFYDYNF